MDSSLVALMMLSLLLGCACWLLFLWAVKDGQFSDIERPKHRMLDDDDDDVLSYPRREEKRERAVSSEVKPPLPSPPPPGLRTEALRPAKPGGGIINRRRE